MQKKVIRGVALLDMAVTLPFALPFIAEIMILIISELDRWLGFYTPSGQFDIGPLAMMFVHIMGVLGVIGPKLYEKRRRIVLTSRLLFVRGRVQKEGIVIHVVADDLEDWTSELGLLSAEDISETVGTYAKDMKHAGRDTTHNQEEQRRLRAARFVPRSRDFH